MASAREKWRLRRRRERVAETEGALARIAMTAPDAHDYPEGSPEAAAFEAAWRAEDREQADERERKAYGGR